MVPEPGGGVHVRVGMVDDVEPPEEGNHVLRDVHQPADEKVERQETHQHGEADARIQPVHESELMLPAPVADEDDHEREQPVYDQVQEGEEQIDAGMSDACFPETKR